MALLSEFVTCKLLPQLDVAVHSALAGLGQMRLAFHFHLWDGLPYLDAATQERFRERTRSI
jgi:hypothetical protein